MKDVEFTSNNPESKEPEKELGSQAESVETPLADNHVEKNAKLPNISKDIVNKMYNSAKISMDDLNRLIATGIENDADRFAKELVKKNLEGIVANNLDKFIAAGADRSKIKL